jgi:membrane-associated protease RseP (regulator of RpoE activity)
MIDRLELLARFRIALADSMTVESYEFDESGVVRLRGVLKSSPERVYGQLREKIEALGYTPQLRTFNGNQHELVVVPGVAPRQEIKVDPKVNLWLFLATVLSTVATYALLPTFKDQPAQWIEGVMFAAALLGILVAHEMGHYVVAKIRKAPVSLPFFIPLPFLSIGGTMGAVIVQREPFEDRRALLEIGIAGPLAGFIVALPLFVLGCWLSDTTIRPAPPSESYFGDSFLTQLIGTAILGSIYTDPTVVFEAHPVLLGAWIGLLITGINLIPAGQLDGGHIAYAVLGDRAKTLNWIVIVAMLGLSLISPAWILWSFLLFMFGRQHPPLLNPSLKLEAYHYALGVIALLVFILTFVPRPIFSL